jgi:hypothetical protein
VHDGALVEQPVVTEHSEDDRAAAFCAAHYREEAGVLPAELTPESVARLNLGIGSKTYASFKAAAIETYR